MNRLSDEDEITARSKMEKGLARGSVSDCWFWTLSVGSHGYGQINFGENRIVCAHRVAYILEHGSIPDGLHICHTCDNKRCCNPDHLFAGTRFDNMSDMSRKRRQWLQSRPESVAGSKNPSSKLDEGKVREIRALADDGESFARLSEVYGVTRTMIGYIVRRKNWRHVA